MRRIHILLGSYNTRTIAHFIVSSLLISHGVRRNAEAWIQVKDKLLVVEGGRVRHLRPDLVSAESWVKAVLYKGKADRLGATISTLDQADMIDNKHCVDTSNRLQVNIAHNKVAAFIYGNYKDEQCTGYIGLGADLFIGFRPALINIILDRLQEGLPVL
ncbi:MAG: hypothetical protein GSR85_11870 [Desulfurococcales archaeon]|nr:hypothetical protein [Desulfurococcales archaeon]